MLRARTRVVADAGRYGSAVRRLGWRWAATVWREGQTEVDEDLTNDVRIPDGADEAKTAPTARTAQHVQFERTPHQHRPDPVACSPRPAGFVGERDSPGLALIRILGWRSAIGDDARAPLRMRGENAVIEKLIALRSWDESREPFQEFDGVEQQARGPVMPGRLQCHQHAPIGSEVEAILRESGTQHIPTEPFQPSTIIRGHVDIGVKVEAVQMRLARPAGDANCAIRFLPKPPHPRAGASAESHAALH